MKTLLYLDDFSNPKWNCDFDGQIIWVKNFVEFTEYLKNNPIPDNISFDHDLGTGTNGIIGLDCAKYLVKHCMDNNLPIPAYTIHSSNPVGAENINSYMQCAIKNLILGK
jgi:hypothetical protein